WQSIPRTIRSASQPARRLDGRYILSDCTNGKIWATSDEFGHGPMEELFNSPFIEVVTFGQDSAGEIYLAGTAGQVYRLAPAGPPVPDPPALLSQLGVFSNVATLAPSPGVIPYDVSTPLWSDAAKKGRWLIVPNDGQADRPNEQIDVSSGDTWQFPVGTVFVKVSSPEARYWASLRASRRSVLTRSPLLTGISDGATTSQMSSGAAASSCRLSA
ncbi:MAG: hypothetical protein ABI895_36105, partial [Deltaproteobacteria bacterium]